MVNRAPCNFETIWNVIGHLTFISKFFVVHISYDWYKHHKNPNLYDRIMMFNKVKCYQLLSTAVALSITGFSFLNCSVLELTILLHMLVPLLTIVIMVEYSYIWSIQLLNQHRSRPAGIYLLKVNNRNTRTWCEISLLLTLNIFHTLF